MRGAAGAAVTAGDIRLTRPGRPLRRTRCPPCGSSATVRQAGEEKPEDKTNGRWLIGWQRPGHPPVLAYADPGQRPSFEAETPRPLFESPRLQRSGIRLSFARSLRGSRGVDLPIDRRSPPSSESRSSCFRCCKLRASRVLEFGSLSLTTGWSPLTEAQQIPDKPRNLWCSVRVVGLLPDRLLAA